VLAIEGAANDAIDTQQRTGLRAIAKHDAGGFVRSAYATRRAFGQNRNVAVVFADDELELHDLPK
jgi:hypothetical protein